MVTPSMRINRSRAMLMRGPTMADNGSTFRASRQGSQPQSGPAPGLMGQGAPRQSGVTRAPSMGLQPLPPGGSRDPRQPPGGPGMPGANPGTTNGLGLHQPPMTMTNPQGPGRGPVNPQRPGTGPAFGNGYVPNAPITGEREGYVRSMYDAPDPLRYSNAGRSFANGGVGVFGNPHALPAQVSPGYSTGGDWMPGDDTDLSDPNQQQSAFNGGAIQGEGPGNELDYGADFARLYGAATGHPFDESGGQGSAAPPSGDTQDTGDGPPDNSHRSRSHARTGTNSSGLAADNGDGGDGSTGTGTSSSPLIADDGGDSASPVHDPSGRRVDPDTGAVIPDDYGHEGDTGDSPGVPYGTHIQFNNPVSVGDDNYASANEQPGGDYGSFSGSDSESVNGDSYSQDDKAWIDYLRKNGYDVGTDHNGNTYIRGDSGGWGDSHTYHGSFNDKNHLDWTDSIKSLWSRFQDDTKSGRDKKAHDERVRQLQELFGLIPDSPQISDESANQMIQANQQLGAFHAGRSSRAALALAGRGAMSPGVMAGLTAESGNQFALQQQQQAAEIRHQIAMTNLEGQRQTYAYKIGALNDFLRGEQDHAVREQALQQQKELLQEKSRLEMAMQAEQQRAEKDRTRWQAIGSLVGGAAGAIGGAFAAPFTGGAVNPANGAQMGSAQGASVGAGLSTF